MKTLRTSFVALCLVAVLTTVAFGAALLPDGEYQITVFDSYWETIPFIGTTVTVERLGPVMLVTSGTVKGDMLTVGTATVNVTNNDIFAMDFFLRGRLKATRDVILFRMTKGGPGNPAFNIR